MKKRDSFNYYDTSEEIIYDNESMYYYDDIREPEKKFNGTMEFTAVRGHNLDYNVRPLGNETMLIGVPAQTNQGNTNTNSFVTYQNPPQVVAVPQQPHPAQLAPYEQYLQKSNYVYPTNYNDFPTPPVPPQQVIIQPVAVPQQVATQNINPAEMAYNPYAANQNATGTHQYNNNHQNPKNKQYRQFNNPKKNKKNFHNAGSSVTSYDNLVESEQPMFYENYEEQYRTSGNFNATPYQVQPQKPVEPVIPVPPVIKQPELVQPSQPQVQQQAPAAPVNPAPAPVAQQPASQSQPVANPSKSVAIIPVSNKPVPVQQPTQQIIVKKEVVNPHGPNPFNSQETQELIQETVKKQNEINKASYQKHVQNEQKTKQLERKVNELQQMLTNVTTNFGKAVSTLSNSLNNTQEMLRTRQTQTLAFRNDDSAERKFGSNSPKKPSGHTNSYPSSKRRR